MPIAWQPDPGAPAPPDIGGKALGLLRLARAGAPTPPWRVLPASVAMQRPWRAVPAALEELRALYEALDGGHGVAVRSSATCEDDAHASFAGVFDTVFCAAPGGLAAALDRVIDSLDGARAHTYERAHHLGAPPQMAVIVQRVVAPRMAGVAFSAHPAQADPALCYVEAVAGPGRLLADGERTPARYWLESATGACTRSEPSPDCPDPLPAEVCATLTACLLRLEREFEAPLDLEWALDAHGAWWALQARPIAALHAHPALHPAQCCTSWFFDQRFAEPIRPIAQTALLPIIGEVVFRDALAMRGAPAPADPFVFYAGQAYVPHALWRAMLRGAPRWFLSPDLRQLFPAQCACGAPPRARLGGMLHYAWCALRSVWRLRADVFGNLGAWRRFEQDLDAMPSATALPPPEDAGAWEGRWHALEEASMRFLRLHRWSYLWADYLFRLHRMLGRALPRAAREAFDRARDAGAPPITREANEAFSQLLDNPAPTQDAIDDFVARYGHRSASLDWATPTWADLARAGRLAEAAPALPPVARRMDRPASGPLAASMYPLRAMLALRESQRFAWERILARQRAMLLDAAAHFHAQGLIGDAGEVWYLTWDEFLALLRNGTPPQPDAIAARRHAHYVYTRIPRPLFIGPERHAPPRAASGAVLHGLGASSGIAEGIALVVPHHAPLPRALPPGRIVVLAALDPAWTALMPHAAGFVIERGGLLSHAAILAREYGVPLVIGIDHATTRLHTGARLAIDGDAGTVAISDASSA